MEGSKDPWDGQSQVAQLERGRIGDDWVLRSFRRQLATGLGDVIWPQWAEAVKTLSQG